MSKSDNRERRKYSRFSLDNGAYAVIDSKPAPLGHIIDISSDGMSFLYAGGGLEVDRTMELGIYLYSQDISIDELPARVVSRAEVKKDNLFDFVVLIRYGLQFHNLAREQKIEVMELLKNFSDKIV